MCDLAKGTVGGFFNHLRRAIVNSQRHTVDADEDAQLHFSKCAVTVAQHIDVNYVAHGAYLFFSLFSFFFH